MKLPGQPWRRSKGMAEGLEEKRAVKWIVYSASACLIRVV